MNFRHYTIQQAASAVGRSTKTLRRYEAAGLLPVAQRDRNGHRVYTEEDIARMALVFYPSSKTTARERLSPTAEVAS